VPPVRPATRWELSTLRGRRWLLVIVLLTGGACSENDTAAPTDQPDGTLATTPQVNGGEEAAVELLRSSADVGPLINDRAFAIHMDRSPESLGPGVRVRLTFEQPLPARAWPVAACSLAPVDSSYSGLVAILDESFSQVLALSPQWEDGGLQLSCLEG
jgi:hypothetical protein